jgi:hypothetical protein
VSLGLLRDHFPPAPLLAELEDILKQESDEKLDWLSGEITAEIHRGPTPEAIENALVTDDGKIRACTILQAFFMGYYYSLLLQVVDTSGLTSQVVEGSWGYRPKEAMQHIRHRCGMMKKGRISRERLMEIAFGLFSGQNIQMLPVVGVDWWCLGVVGKRTLVIDSLVGDSDTPKGRDVSGTQLRQQFRDRSNFGATHR